MQAKENFEHKLSDFITENQLFTAADRLLLAVSGGMDSMVMSEALFGLGYQISIAHANYRLREEESDEDEKFVQNWAEISGVECFTKQFETKKIAALRKKGIQETARQLRYEWFDELRRLYGFTRLLTAHHLGDALETTLYRLAKGSGVIGLRGIPLKQGYIVRPMMAFTRQEIEEYARACRLSWREDSTNESHAYTRNFIRHQITPLLEKINPAMVAHFADTRERLSDAAEWLQAAFREAESKCVRQSGEFIYLNINRLQELPSPRLFLYEYLKKFGFNYKTAAAIAKNLNNISGTKFCSASHCATISRNQLIISPVELPYFPPVEIPDFGTYSLDNQHSISVERVTASRATTDNRYKVRVNPAALRFPLLVRHRQAGDYMQPLGMQGKKKVSDILTDLKVPLPEKNNVRVLCNADGQIVWLIGYRLAEIGRITDFSTPVVEISYT